MLSKKYCVCFSERAIVKQTGKKQSGRAEYELMANFCFFVSGNMGTFFYTIPKGFIHDFASIPFGARNIFPPDDPEYSDSTIMHDWLYGGALCNRKQADELFLSGMAERKTNAIRRAIIFSCVRAGGWLTYGKNVERRETIRRMIGVTSNFIPLVENLFNFRQPKI